MKICFRWFGKDDRIGLNYINQIPGLHGIVSAIYDVPVGEVWPLRKIMELKKYIEQYGLKFEVIESVPVHEDIKLGLSTRDKYITNYSETLKNLGKAKIGTVTYNFMALFDWTRTDLNHILKDGSKGLKYEEKKLEKLDPSNKDFNLPGWDTSYGQNELSRLFEQYQKNSKEDLWENLDYFLNKIVPVAERSNINLAIHPDDPPWNIFNLPRIITDEKSIERLINLVDSPNNGLAICSGSLGVNPENNIPNIIRKFGERIHFGHVRNIKITGERSFEETAHLSTEGSLDLYQIMKAYHDIGFKGPIRPDHGRMIWNEEGKPGYGLYDRALGVSYLSGLWEAIIKSGI